MIAKRLTADFTTAGFRFRPLYLLFAAFAVSLCLSLSHWQWQRAQQAEIRYQHFLQQRSAPPVSLQQATTDYQRVSVAGRVDKLFLLDNQLHQGQVGWHVLVRLVSPQGPVLVNLGWTSKQSQPQLQDFTALSEVSGRIKTAEPGLMLAPATDDPAWPGILQQVDIALLNQQLDMQLPPYVIYAEAPPAGLVPVSAAPENKYPMHAGYAVQWLLIGLACLVTTLIACRRRKHDA